MHLPSRSIFVKMIFFHFFYYLLPVPIFFWQQSWFYIYPPLSDKLIFFMIWTNSISWVPPLLVQDKSVLNKEQERDSRSCSLFSTDLFCTKRGYRKLQNRTQEIASTRIPWNEINQKFPWKYAHAKISSLKWERTLCTNR